MTAVRSSDADVVIVGFGPVGMTLAGLLGRRGIRTVVIEKEPDVFALPRAAHIDHTGLRTMQEIGRLDEILAPMIPNRGLVLTDHRLDPLVRIPGDQGSISGLPASMYFYQPDFDRTLERGVRRMASVDVRRCCEMVDFHQDATGVTVRYRNLVDGAMDHIRGTFAVGCDGAWSPVRERLGIGLESLEFDERWLVLDLKRASGRQPLPDYAIQVCDPARPWVANPIPGGRYRVELKLYEYEGDPEIDRLRDPDFIHEHLRPLLGTAEFDIERRAIYTFHGLVATTWRTGRVLLAGDAAHQMPPFLGQGMCSGIRDAANLGWKLALALSGSAHHDALLDSYQAERAPHVRSVVASAVQFGQFVSVTDPVAVAERNARLRSEGVATAPSFSVPPLTPGRFVGTGGGSLFPQPAVDGPGRRLDDILGQDTVVVAVEPAALDESLVWWEETFLARAVLLDQLGPAGDPLRRWFAGRGWTVAVVRPDRYLMAAGTQLRDLRPALDSDVADGVAAKGRG